MDELIVDWAKRAKAEMGGWLGRSALEAIVSLERAEEAAQRVGRAAVEAFFEAWTQRLEQEALRIGGTCPGCGHARKCRRRAGQLLEVHVLGLTVRIPKLYLNCERCDAPGVSITRLLTGLSSGDTSAAMELAAAYCAAERSYGKASRDLEVHYGEPVERTKVRRLALEVEAEALRFAEQERQQALDRVGQEGTQAGEDLLMVQGDGGIVRTGVLVACEPSDPGYGKRTAKSGCARRKRQQHFREIITMDVRPPGQVEATALDVVVPAVAKPDERSTRMLALAARQGLGTDTEVIGLGDLGSKLPDAFDEAFHDHPGFYCGDWRHTSEYAHKAAAVLTGIDAARWEKEMKAALWHRRAKQRDQLLAQAHAHRMPELPAGLDKCPLGAVDTYVHNNWHRLRAKDLKNRGLDFVSARAEAQVRERTKRRFAVPGAWRTEQLEGKALLRAIIADGRWPRFREHYLKERIRLGGAALRRRLEDAVQEGRLVAMPTGLDPISSSEERIAA